MNIKLILAIVQTVIILSLGYMYHVKSKEATLYEETAGKWFIEANEMRDECKRVTKEWKKTIAALQECNKSVATVQSYYDKCQGYVYDLAGRIHSIRTALDAGLKNNK